MRRILVVLGLALVAVGEFSTSGLSVVERLADVAAGGTFLAVGVAQWDTSRRLALLAYAAGGAWFIGAALPAVLWVHRPLMLHTALGFPSGRLPTRASRILLGAAWLAAVVPTLARAPWASFALAAAAAAIAWNAVSRAPMTRRAAARVSATATSLVATGLAYPAVAQAPALALPQLPSVGVAYATCLAAGGLVLLAGRQRPEREAELVIELRGRDPEEALTLLRAEAESRPDRAGQAALASAADRLQVNLDLQARLAERTTEVRRSQRRLVEAAVQERGRLEQQVSSGALPYLDRCDLDLESLAQSPSSRTASLARQGRQEIALTRDDLEQLAHGLHPRVLTESGLTRALADLAAHGPVPTSVTAPDGRFPDLVEATVYYACAEALANVAKHAQATRVSVQVTVEGRVMTARVGDDGVGGATVEPNGGLSGLRDRLSAVDGELSVVSPPGAGTQVTIRVPLP